MLASCFGSTKDVKDKIKEQKQRYFKRQLCTESKQKIKHMFHIGNFTPHAVYSGTNHDLNSKDAIAGLCSLCENPIHISIGFNPTRLILSHCIEIAGAVKKENSFFITNLHLDVTDVSQITQYDIYTAIQLYIKEHKEFPKYVGSCGNLPIVAI